MCAGSNRKQKPPHPSPTPQRRMSRGDENSEVSGVGVDWSGGCDMAGCVMPIGSLRICDSNEKVLSKLGTSVPGLAPGFSTSAHLGRSSAYPAHCAQGPYQDRVMKKKEKTVVSAYLMKLCSRAAFAT